jgi:hypothetical protein
MKYLCNALIHDMVGEATFGCYTINMDDGCAVSCPTSTLSRFCFTLNVHVPSSFHVLFRVLPVLSVNFASL